MRRRPGIQGLQKGAQTRVRKLHGHALVESRARLNFQDQNIHAGSVQGSWGARTANEA